MWVGLVGCASKLPEVRGPVAQVEPNQLSYSLPMKMVRVELTAVKSTVRSDPRCQQFLAGHTDFRELQDTWTKELSKARGSQRATLGKRIDALFEAVGKTRQAVDELGIELPAYTGPSLLVTKADWAPVVVPDPEAVFTIEVPVGVGKDARNINPVWTPTGLLTSSSSERTDQVGAWATGTLEVAASIAGSFFGLGGSASSAVEGRDPGLPDGLAALEVDQHFCDAAAKRIKRQREGLQALAGGLDGASTKEVITLKEARLKKLLAHNEAHFTGVSAKAGKITCEVVQRGFGAQTLLSWAPAAGPIESSSCTVPASLRLDQSTIFSADHLKAYEGRLQAQGLEPADVAAKLAAVTSKLKMKGSLAVCAKSPSWRSGSSATNQDAEGDGAAPATRASAGQQGRSTAGPTSYAFRKPAPADVWVGKGGCDRSRALSDIEMEWMPQLGSVQRLPRYSGSSIQSKVELDPQTGSLTSLSLTRKPYDFSQATGVAGQVGKVAAAELRPTTDQEELDARKAELEALVAIEAAKKTLAGAD